MNLVLITSRKNLRCTTKYHNIIRYLSINNNSDNNIKIQSNNSDNNNIKIQSNNNDNNNNEKLLYKGNSSLQILLMFGLGCVNTIYFSQYLFASWYYQDVVVQGIQLGGDPRWGYVGAFTGGLVFYSTKWLAHSSVYRAYLTEDNLRVGFQLYNIFGKPGRKIECLVSNIRWKDNKEHTSLGSSYTPIRVKGIEHNILIDKAGEHFHNRKLIEILNNNSNINNGNSSITLNTESKEARIKWKSEAYKQSKNKK